MKKILAITLTLLASMTVSAQKTVENSFLSINVPRDGKCINWTCQELVVKRLVSTTLAHISIT